MKALVLGGMGFIGQHLAARLYRDGDVRGVDIKPPKRYAIDLRTAEGCAEAFDDQVWDEVYQLAADVGGAGYIYDPHNDMRIMKGNALINIGVLNHLHQGRRFFFSSSSCVYGRSGYGAEKVFSEQMWQSTGYASIARLPTVYGPGQPRGRMVADLCAKVIAAPDGGEVEVWGDGMQTRSLLYVDDCVEMIVSLMRIEHDDRPIDFYGTEGQASANWVARTLIDISGKDLRIKHVGGHLGPTSHPMPNSSLDGTTPLREGLRRTYEWMSAQPIAA